MDTLTSHHHLLIGGTGRAGSSFLVRYLTAAGLETTLSRYAEYAFWDNHAEAGLEESPLAKSFAQMPYVIKTPWLYEIIDSVLADPTLRIDAVIIPVRRLHDAAASRVIVQLRDIYQCSPWMAEQDKVFSNWSTAAAGGCMSSLDPVDQARLLATGFHLLVERLVEADIPIVFLAFPRFAQDADYAFHKLSRFMPTMAREQALEIHARLADPTKIRVDDELRSVNGAVTVGATDYATLDNAAIRRELVRCRHELDVLKWHVARRWRARLAAWVVSSLQNYAQRHMRQSGKLMTARR
jgi:hypothetical protein